MKIKKWKVLFELEVMVASCEYTNKTTTILEFVLCKLHVAVKSVPVL